MNENALGEGEPVFQANAEPVIVVRGHPVMLAARVAQAFGVETREVTQTIRRNPAKFREMHGFKLTEAEVEDLTSQGVISKSGRGGSRALPWVLTHKGVVRLAMIMNAPAALQATDLIIDLFIEVHGQVRRGETQIAIANPSRLAPDADSTRQFNAFRRKLLDALDSLLGVIINPANNTTVRDELEDIGNTSLNYLKDRLKTRGLENEKIEAETLHILEKVREIRERTSADVRKSHAETEKITLDNLDKKIGIVERLLTMANQMEPNAMVGLLGQFAPSHPLPAPGQRLSPRRIGTSSDT